MNTPAELENLLIRFLDDRESLSDDDWTDLAVGLKLHPEAVVRLRDQLIVDETLSQKLSSLRGDFHSQIDQRISDYLSGEEELNRQADELRGMALSRLEDPIPAPTTSRTFWTALALALSILLVVGVAVQTINRQTELQTAVSIESAQGKSVIRRKNDNDHYAEANLELRQGDRLIVGTEATVTLRYEDGTTVKIEENTVLDFPRTRSGSGKRVFLDTGKLTASIEPQPRGMPMVFETPSADAVVKGTELTLDVRSNETILEVTEGIVDLVERRSGETISITATESARASAGKLALNRTLRWPASDKGLVYLYSASRWASINGASELKRVDGRLVPSSLQTVGTIETQRSPTIEFKLDVPPAASGYRDEFPNIDRLNNYFTLETVFISTEQPADVWRNIVSVQPAGEAKGNFLLAQKGKELAVVVGGSLEDVNKGTEQIALISLGEAVRFDETMHVVIGYSDGRWYAYVNGARVPLRNEHRPLPRIAKDATYYFAVGSDSATNASPWLGRVSGAAFFDRPLTEAEASRSFSAFQADQTK